MTVKNVIIVSDLHVGCRMGLCHPDGMDIDDGGVVMPSILQRRVWGWWREFWDEWVPMVTRGEPYAVVVNGDAIDGVHHGSTSQMSHNIEDQIEMAFKILEPEVKKASHYFHIRGTEVHVGKSGVDEERLAKRLKAVPDKKQYARWELWLKVGRGLVHIMHHIGTSGSMAYETTAVQKELEQAFVEAGRWDDEIPDCIVRSHRHRNIETRCQCYKGFATACTTAGWQLKTPFTYRIAGARQTQPQIGGTLVRCGDEDIYTRHKLWKIERPQIVSI